MSEHSTIFVVSDQTGITVEKLVHTLLTQFDVIPANRIVRPFLDSPAKIARCSSSDNHAKVRGS